MSAAARCFRKRRTEWSAAPPTRPPHAGCPALSHPRFVDFDHASATTAERSPPRPVGPRKRHRLMRRRALRRGATTHPAEHRTAQRHQQTRSYHWAPFGSVLSICQSRPSYTGGNPCISTCPGSVWGFLAWRRPPCSPKARRADAPAPPPTATKIQVSKIILIGDSTVAVQGGWGSSFAPSIVTLFVRRLFESARAAGVVQEVI